MVETAFMVMPFGDNVSNIAYNQIIKPTLIELGFDLYRADEIFSVNPIYDDIFTAIEKSSLVIVDISGRNPNCFYELGISHTLKPSRTVMVTHDGYEKIPFDISHFRIIHYENTIDGKGKFEVKLRRTIESIRKGLPEFYKQEFEIVEKIFEGHEAGNDLLALIGIDKSEEPARIDSSIVVEGHVKNEPSIASVASADDQMRPFIKLGYAQVLDDRIVLTDKGKYFVNYLIDLGYTVDYFNGKKFTDGYVTYFERVKREKDNQRPKDLP